ncbi:stalk domain-containing protein [Paenibacillus sp. NEAU-GSW1]|uniref:stalk domain-containing protein n=1 Tax=Paenibacillus sp. NEAU-GSW1 TaxID=2682486 RepID=UPI0012E12A4D
MYRNYRKNKTRIAVLLLTATITVTSLWTSGSGSRPAHAAGEQQTAKTEENYQIVALGDSLTAGYELGFSEQSVPYGYVEHVFEQALFHGERASYVNYGIIGLKSAGLHKLVQAAADGNTVHASDVQEQLPDPRAERIVAQTKEIKASIADADLIVMTMGGNDLLSMMNVLAKDTPLTEATEILNELLDSYEQELKAALQTIVKLNPKARIAIADQYLPVPAPIKVGSATIEWYPEDDRQFLLGGSDQLRNRLNGIVAELNKNGGDALAVNISTAFLGNETTYTTIAKGDIHPNYLGYAAMGRAYAEAIWGDYRTVRQRAAGIPISVVVEGNELPASAAPPVLRSNRTFVAMRDITDAVGAKISWSTAKQTATVVYGGHQVEITIGSEYYVIDGQKKKLSSPPAFLLGKKTKTYLPLAALSEALGLQVTYRQPLQTVFINK